MNTNLGITVKLEKVMGVKIVQAQSLVVAATLKFDDGTVKTIQPFFEIRILTASLKNVDLPHLSMWSPATEVDETAKTLSRMLKNDQEIWVMYRGSVKAAYQDGARVMNYDMREANPDLTDDEYTASKIRDSETNEWV